MTGLTLSRGKRVRSAFIAVALLGLGAGCRSEKQSPNAVESAAAEPDAAASAPWLDAVQAPPVPKGMVWIPGGALVAGTPKELLPRKADQEMPGEQVVLDGFFIDIYAFPNEQGAIPRSNMTFEEARALCEEQGKRLCSELEWERACKGPRNFVYEYGQGYQASICKTGEVAKRLPSGYLFGCRSEFGVHDMHGSLWEWTDSPWGRAQKGDKITQRGGNGIDGNVVGRCANARPYAPGESEQNVGARCCQGPRNAAEVSLGINKGQALKRVTSTDRELTAALEKKLPETVQASMRDRGVFHVAHLWEWKPVANEDLLLASGCAGVPPSRRCGVLIVRRTLGRLDVLGWADSGHFVPIVRLEYNPLKLWVYGGDTRSHFRRPLLFDWGDVRIGEVSRNADARYRPAKQKPSVVDKRRQDVQNKFGVSGAKRPGARRPSTAE